jgi:hypothetical protein
MKKLLSVVLVLGLMVVFAGCSNKSADLKVGRVEYAAHGDKSFAVTVVAMDGDKIAMVSIDEYQFLAVGDDVVGVPNSTGAFGDNYADKTANVLASKRTNDEFYSDMMKDHAQATKKLSQSYVAIEEFCVGKTIKELEDIVAKTKEQVVDEVSGSTLVDTQGYIKSVIAAAKAAK